jgi:hypothetical protein
MSHCSNMLKGSHLGIALTFIKLHWPINLTLSKRLPRLTDLYRAMLSSYIITIFFHAHFINNGRGQYLMKDRSQSIHPTRKLNLQLFPNHSNFNSMRYMATSQLKQRHCIVILKPWVQALATLWDSFWMEFQWCSISVSAVYPWTIIPPSISIYRQPQGVHLWSGSTLSYPVIMLAVPSDTARDWPQSKEEHFFLSHHNTQKLQPC